MERRFTREIQRLRISAKIVVERYVLLKDDNQMLDRRGRTNMSVIPIIGHCPSRRDEERRGKTGEFKLVLHCVRSRNTRIEGKTRGLAESSEADAIATEGRQAGTVVSSCNRDATNR